MSQIEIKRNSSFDITKGIGIILVIIGHTMSPIMSGNKAMEKFYSILYIFHMPLFFLLSGLVSRKLIGGISNQFILKADLIKQRAVRLMIPYFSWAIIYSIMKPQMKEMVRFEGSYSPWTILIGNNPAGQLWFLYVLFACSVVTILFVTRKTLKWWVIGTGAVSVLAPFISASISLPGIGVSFSLYQIGFFFLGLFISPNRDSFFLRGSITCLCSVFFIAYVVLKLICINILILKAFAAFCASYMCIYLSFKLMQSRIGEKLAWLGKQSMSLYILHAPILVVGRTILMKIMPSQPWAYVAVLSMSATIFSLLLSHYFIQRIRILNLLLFGVNKN